MFSLKKAIKFYLFCWTQNAAAIFLFFNSAPASCKLCLLGLKMLSYFLSDGEFYLVFRYGLYVFLLILSVVFFIFPAKSCKNGYRNAVNSDHLFYFFVYIFFHK